MSSARLRRPASKRFVSKTLRAAAAAACMVMAAPGYAANTLFWDGATPTPNGVSDGTSGTWSTAVLNWDNGGASDIAWPGAGNIADFGGTAGTATLGTAITADGIIFENVPGYTIATSTFALSLGASGITANNTSGIQTISGTGAVTLTAAQTWNVAPGGTLAVSAPISGSVLLTKDGAGTLTFSGTNTYTGGVAVNGGTLSFGAETNLGTGGVTLTNGGALTYTGATYVATAKTTINVGTGGGTLTIPDVKVQLAVANEITGSGTLTRAGTVGSVINNLSITAANTGFSGAWVFTGGVTEVGGTNSLGNNSATNTLTLSGGELAASNATVAQAITINSGTLGGDNGTVSGSSNYSGPITINNPFNIRLGDFYQSFFRNMAISGNITGTASWGYFNGNNTTVATGGIGQTLFLNGDNSGYSPNSGTTGLNIPAGIIVSFGSPASIPASGVSVNGANTFTLGGIGVGYVPASQSALPTLNQNNTSTFGGVFEINVANFNVPLDLGTLYGTSTSPIGGANGLWYLGSGGSGTYTATTLAAAFDTSSSTYIYRLGGGYGNLTIANGVLVDNVSASSVVVGGATANLVGSNGTGTVTLQAANTYTGPTTINLGHSLIITNGGALGSTASGTTINAGGNLSFSGNITIAEPLTINGNASGQTISNISNALVNISGNNTITSDITIASLASGNARVSSTAGTLSLPVNISYGGATTTSGLVFAGAGTITSSGVISGSMAVFTTNTGTVTISGANTYTGANNFQNGTGTYSVSSIGSVGSASSGLGAQATAALATLQFGTTTLAGALAYNGTGETTNRVINLAGTTGGATLTQSGSIGLLKFTSNLTATGAGIKTLTLQGSTVGTGELAGVIPDNSTTNTTSVTKAGSGTWTLSAANTFTGKTTINGGTLAINTLNSVSGGASSLGNPTTAANGTIAVGTSTTAATLSYIGASSTSNRVINLAGTTGGATLDMSGTGTFTLTSALTATGAGDKTLTLTGGTTGIGVINGAIVDNSSTNTTAVTKSGSGTWILGGTNSYTGATTISGGLLRINGSTNAASAVTINTGGSALGGTGTVNGAVTAAAGGSLDLRDTTVGTLNLASTLTLSGSAANPNNLFFDLGSSTGDKIAVTGAVTAGTANGALITLNPLTGSSIADGTVFTLITAGAASTVGSFALATTQSGGHTYTLNATPGTGNIVQVTVNNAITSTVASAVWGGTATNTWKDAGNWYTDATGATATGAAPGIGSNVSFYINSGATNLSTTLGADFEINSLTFGTNATSPVTIAGSPFALTIDAGTANGNAAGNGINQQAAATHTISARLGLGGPQTWTVAASGGLTVSGLVFDTGPGMTLTKAGPGTLTLSNTANTFTGDIALTNGVLAFVGNSGASGDPVALGAGTKTITLTNNAVLRVITTTSNPTSTNTKKFVVGTGGGTFDVGTTGILFQLDDANQFSGTGDLTVTSSAGATSTGVVFLNNQTYNFTGNVFVNSGTLRLGTNAILGTTTGRTITVAAGGALDMNSNTAIVPLSVTLNGTGISSGGALTAATAAGTLPSDITLASASSIGGANTLTLNGAIGGAFTLTKVGAGLTLLTGTNTYGPVSGNTTAINAGILQAAKVASLPNFATNSYTVASGGMLALNVGGTGEFTTADVTTALNSGNFANGSGIGIDTTNAPGGTVTAPNIAAASATTQLNFAKMGSGTLLLPNANAFGTGSTSVFNGTLSVTSGVNNSLGTGALTLGTFTGLVAGAAGSLNLGTTSQSVTTLTVQSNTATVNTLTIATGQTLTASGNVFAGSNATSASTTNFTGTGGGSLIVGSVGTPATTFTIGGSNATASIGNRTVVDFSGLSSLNVNLNTSTGVFRISPDNTSSTSNANNSDSTLILPSTGAGNSTITSATMSIGAGATFNAATQLNALKLGTGSNALNVNTLNLGTGSRDFGSLTFNSGSGSVTINGTGGAAAATAFNMGTGTTATTVGGGTNTFNVAGHAATLNFGASTIGNQPRSSNSTNNFSWDDGSLTMLNLTAGTRGGAAATAANTLNTTITLGSATSTVSDTATITNGILSLGAANPTAAAFNTTVSATLNIAGGTVGIGATSGTSVTMATATSATSPNVNSVSALISITGGVANFSGNILKGTADASNSATLSATATVTLNGGTLNMNGNVIGSAANAIAFNLQSGTLNALGNSNGGAAVNKTTSGTLTITGTNAYPGATTISAGTVVLNGTLSGTSGVTVASGATLKGSGNVTSAVAVTVNGTLSPGNSPGTMTLSGPLSLPSNSTYIEEIGGTTPGNSTNNYDQVTAAGITLGGNLTVADFNGFPNSDANQLYFMLVNSLPSPDQLTNRVNGTFNGLPEGATVTLTDGVSTGQITYTADFASNGGPNTGNDVALYNVNIVPEPASIGLLGLGAIGLLARRRRRRA